VFIIKNWTELVHVCALSAVFFGEHEVPDETNMLGLVGLVAVVAELDQAMSVISGLLSQLVSSNKKMEPVGSKLLTSGSSMPANISEPVISGECSVVCAVEYKLHLCN